MEKKELGSLAITNDDNYSNYLSGNLFLSPTASQTEKLEFDFASGELFNPASFSSSTFPPKFISQSQFSFSSPSDCSFEDDVFNIKEVATENPLSEANFILEYQQLYNSYTMCLTSLQDSVKEVDTLRQEQEALCLANIDLVRRLNLSTKDSRKNRLLSSETSFPSSSLIRDFNHLSIGAAASVGLAYNVSPKSVFEPNQLSRHSSERVSMPKSISVPSMSFNDPDLRQQHIRVAREKKTGARLKFGVYNQGMSKTEVCNKWQETGRCPYGENCKFAHGISELRPVIRHPRYKTEVCRMVLAGHVCPYGHRCHFRHSLTDEEMRVAVNQR